MMSFLTGLSSSVYLYIIAGLLTLVVVFGGLLYHEIGKTAEAESALVSAINANTSLQKSLDLKDFSCKIDDVVSTERQEEKIISDKAKDTEISSIDKLPTKPKSIPTTTKVASDESNTVDIDSDLPADLISVLSQSYNRAKGRTGDVAGQSTH